MYHDIHISGVKIKIVKIQPKPKSSVHFDFCTSSKLYQIFIKIFIKQYEEMIFGCQRYVVRFLRTKLPYIRTFEINIVFGNLKVRRSPIFHSISHIF